MSSSNTFSTTLKNLRDVFSSALKTTEQLSPPVPAQDGISLLDVKNEIFLSYLHNLVFLILLRLRNSKTDADKGNEDLDESVVRKLVELQVYSEKGVRQLENRLKYQIEKVLRAADEINHEKAVSDKNHEQIDASNSESDSDDNSTTNIDLKAPKVDDLQYRPNPADFARRAISPEEPSRKRSEDGIYKPPRIQPIAMPMTGNKEKETRKPQKSATVEEFINSEMSIMPTAVPSIGSTIVRGGRSSKSEKERIEERERKEYEERNYVRLPKESKKERAKKKGSRQNAGYGGEEWRGLGEGIDRIERLTQKKSGEGRTVLERSRKRPIEEKLKGAVGLQAGEGFQKRLKMLDGGRRDRGKR
ncbi:hypothetical protein K3495_g2147 [Podosphaera aphanis]|nr:hypothetical protein K3495_g2147 [Podosphaera aphanis]